MVIKLLINLMNSAEITVHIVENLHSSARSSARAAEIGACEQRMSHARKKNKCNLRTFVVISFA